MKVALVGNMNNNFFSLMRYLRDLNVDAYLLLYENELEHFKPEHDTWHIEKWEPFIKQTKLINGGLKSFFGYSPSFIKNELEGYDYYIANGFAPALFSKAGIRIDLFMPYAVNIEYTYFYNKSKITDYVVEPIFKFFQKRGLTGNVKLLGTVDASAYEKALRYKLNVVPLAMPMVYQELDVGLSDYIGSILSTLAKYSLVIFSHVSHFPQGTQGYKIKRNDLFIKGFAKYLQNTSDKGAILVLLDYGQGVNDSKELISELGISESVIWLPKMSRKELMLIIRHIDIGAGEFGGEMWGGTVWEFMSWGKPFFQYVNLKDEEIAKLLNAPCPEFFNTNDPDEIAQILIEYKGGKRDMGEVSRSIINWFDQYAGVGLAKVYRNLILGY